MFVALGCETPTQILNACNFFISKQNIEYENPLS